MVALKSGLTSTRMGVGSLTLLVWALAAGSAVYWGLRASSTAGQPVPPVAGVETSSAVDTSTVARALGAKPASSSVAAAPDVLSRLSLRGVVTHDGRGAALIAVGDKPAKPFRVGAEVEDGWSLKSVSPRAAVIASKDREATLQMPAMSERSNDASSTPTTAHPVPPRPGFLPARPGGPQVQPSVAPRSSRD